MRKTLSKGSSNNSMNISSCTSAQWHASTFGSLYVVLSHWQQRYSDSAKLLSLVSHPTYTSIIKEPFCSRKPHAFSGELITSRDENTTGALIATPTRLVCFASCKPLPSSCIQYLQQDLVSRNLTNNFLLWVCLCLALESNYSIPLSGSRDLSPQRHAYGATAECNSTSCV